jgi:hypothetical protein
MVHVWEAAAVIAPGQMEVSRKPITLLYASNANEMSWAAEEEEEAKDSCMMWQRNVINRFPDAFIHECAGARHF